MLKVGIFVALCLHACISSREAIGAASTSPTATMLAEADAVAPSESSASPEPTPNTGDTADRDGDGVPNVSDRCPDQAGLSECFGWASTFPVQIVAHQIVVPTIEFRINSAELQARSHAVLNALAETLDSHPEFLRIQVQGHSDDRESNVSAVPLSTWRSRSVRQYLVAHGVASDRVEALGFGETVPIASNQTETGRAKNRRIEFHITQRR